MLNIFNSQYKSITGAALVLSGATLLSRIVGIIRDRVLAHYFGTGPIIDAYFAAFKIPDLVYNLLIVGALTAGFIPTFTKLFHQGEDGRTAWKLANNILNIAGVSLSVLCLIGMIFTAPLAQIITPGFSGENLARVTSFTRIMFLSPFFLGISMVLGGVLQSLRRFTLYAIAPIFYNLGIVIGTTWLYGIWGDIGLPMGVVLGAIMHCGIQIFGAYHAGYRWQWQFKLNDFETKIIGKLMIPRTLGLGITQFNQVIVTILASLLPVGSISVYNLANNIQAVPIGVIGIPFALAIFPLLSASAVADDKKQFVSYIVNTLRQVIFLITPLTILVLLLRSQIVRVILGSGAFDWNSTIQTADALAFFALGLIAQSLIPLLVRGFYALSNTKTPFIIGVISELISIICALLLMKPFGAPGLAMAASIGVVLNAVMLFISLRHQSIGLGWEQLIPFTFQVSIAAIAMGVVVQFLKYPLAKIFDQQYFWGIFAQGLIAGLAGLVVYGVLCYILKVPELIRTQESLRKRWLKPQNVSATEVVELKD